MDLCLLKASAYNEGERQGDLISPYVFFKCRYTQTNNLKIMKGIIIYNKAFELS